VSWLERFWSAVRGEEDEVPVPTGDPVRIAQVEAVLAEARPMFLADGGDILLVAVDDAGWVEVRLRGACTHCAASEQTLFGALEPRLRARWAWVRGVRRS